jgi:hypothetical protein
MNARNQAKVGTGMPNPRERHGRENVHVRYRSDKHGEAETNVTADERDALHRAGRLLLDRGDSRLLASMDNWHFLPNLKRQRP